jgi:thioredoxin 1
MAADNVLHLTDENFAETVAANATLLVDFWAPWCGPCKMLGPIVDEVAQETTGKVTVAKVNVDDCPQVAGEYRISAIPTLMVFKNGEVVDRSSGLTSKADILAKLS